MSAVTVAELHAESVRLRAAGLTALADWYADKAKRGDTSAKLPPPELRASALLAAKPAPPPFADDSREDER